MVLIFSYERSLVEIVGTLGNFNYKPKVHPVELHLELPVARTMGSKTTSWHCRGRLFLASYFGTSFITLGHV